MASGNKGNGIIEEGGGKATAMRAMMAMAMAMKVAGKEEGEGSMAMAT